MQPNFLWAKTSRARWVLEAMEDKLSRQAMSSQWQWQPRPRNWLADKMVDSLRFKGFVLSCERRLLE
jgi:hypothetical protein